ncbi:Uncharacterized protein GQ600_18020 [Phytophthora cactorum]|nr:Uncharacterized protein GQ600_18020 [Phytophthora cactorum]
MSTKRGRSPSLTDDAPPVKRGNNETGDQPLQLHVNAPEDASALATAVHAVSISTQSSVPITESNTAPEAQETTQNEAQTDVLSAAMQAQQQNGNVSVAAPSLGLMVVAPEFEVVHDSWEAFEEALKAYGKMTFQLYVIRSTTSVKRRNLKIAESAGRGDSSNVGALRRAGMDMGVSEVDTDQVVERTLIPEQYQWYSKSLKLVVTKHVRTHNHQLSKELYFYYTENRRIYDPELLAVSGDTARPSVDLTSTHLTSLIDQAYQRSGLYRMLTSSDDQSQQASSMAFIVSDPSSVVVSGSTTDRRTNKQLVALSDANNGNFVIRPRTNTATALAPMPPLGAMILTPGTIPSRAMDDGGFCVPRVSSKVHASWDAFHDYIAQYAFDTAQVFRTRSTVSVAARNAKVVASIAAKTGGEDHDVASYASYAAASPTSRLIPEEFKWFSKLLICTYGWKRRARGKAPRLEHDDGPCPAMLLARIERNVDGNWQVVINRQVPEHNHKLGGHEETGASNQEVIEAHGDTLTAAQTFEPTLMQSSSVDSSSLMEMQTIATESSVEEPQVPSSNQREVVVRVPKLQSMFKSWDDFHASLKAYSDATYQLYRTRTTSSAQGRNKKITQMKRRGEEDENDENNDNGSDLDALTGVNATRTIPESWRWYSKTLTCTHGWKERHRGTGKRNAHGVRSTACPVKICATVQYMNPSPRLENGTLSAENDDATSGSYWRVVVTKHIVDHNHNLSRELYQHYCENRRIYDPELLAINTSNSNTVVARKAGQGSSDHDDGSRLNNQPDGSQFLPQPPVLSTQLEAGLAEAVNHVQLFGSIGNNHPSSIGASGVTAMPQSVGASTSQQPVPSVVLLPYSTTASYCPNQAQAQQQEMPQQKQQEQQHNLATFAGATGAPLGQTSEGVATLPAVATPGLTPANLVILNNVGMSMGGFPPTGSNVISVACRVHGSSTTDGNSSSSNSANTPATQCTCFRIAGGGNYVTIVPANEHLAPTETSFDADDEAMLYAEEMEGAWQPSSTVEIEKATTDNGELLWRVPRIVRRYPTWEAFHTYLDAYSAATFQLYRVRTTYSVRSRNTRLRQLAASRGLIVREGGNDAETEQEGANGMSRAHLYSEVRRVRDPEVLAQAEQLWRGGATRRRVFEFLKERSPSQVILMKDVHNLVQRWQAQERRRQGDTGGQEQVHEEQPSPATASHDEENSSWFRHSFGSRMAYFQGGDFVELLSAQGNAPAAAWKLQGKISKTFDKGIKGNAFSLDGNAETKMQLPKTASSALGLAQRFVILQLLVPFTRSFSVEICFSDFQKVRRRFVVASAFRDTARTTLHVQLPLNVPRDQWMNLVFDLHTLSEVHFPGSGYRSMESLCISGSCRLKRIFTMKDAPTPSRGSQVVKHADIRDIPRQFVFSATQRGASGAMPIPTQYFALESANVGGVRPVTGQVQPKTVASSQSATPSDTDGNKPGHQRSARVNTVGSKLRRPQSKLGKVIVAQPHFRDNASSSLEIRAATGSDERAMEKERCFEARDSVSPAQMMNKSYEMKKEGIVSVTSPVRKETKVGLLESVFSPPSSVHSSVTQPGEKSLRESIMGEIQQKIANLDGDVLSDSEEDNFQLSSSWRRELKEPIANPPEPTQQRSYDDDTSVKTSISSRYNTNKESIFSFSSLVESGMPPARKNASGLFDFDSLLQDVKPLTRLDDKEQGSEDMMQLERRIESALADDDDDLELTKLLAAKRSARQLTRQTPTKDDTNLLNEHIQSLSTTNEDALEKKSEVRDMMSPRETAAKDRDDWVLIENDTAEVKHDSMINATRVDQEDKESCMDQKEEQDDSDLDLAGDMTGLSIDLTSELSASGGGSDHDPGDDSDYETSVGRARLESPHADETKPESDGDSINPHNDDRDDDASFDFEDLVEAAESADVRDEDEEKHTDYSSSQQKSASIATRLSGDHDPCPPGNQPTREKKRGPPVPPRRMKTIASPLIKSPQRSQDKVSQRESRERPVKSSRPVELSSSFSSRRLQSLLESTDWTAELNAQATNLSNSRGPPSSRSSSKPSARRSTQKRSSRPQTPSSSSIELVYDPILRCYYDPVANKYYALAE